MRKNEREQITPEESVVEHEIEGNFSACIDLQTAISVIMEKVSMDCPIEELMSVAADVAMKFHDGDSAFFFNYDKGMKTARCTYETHRIDFPPICGSEPLYLDEYPALLNMMMDVILGLAARKGFVSFPDLTSLLPKKSREAKRMEQVGLRSVLGVAYNGGKDFIVVVNPRKDTEQGDVLRMLGYILTKETDKPGHSHATDSLSFGKGQLAENEVYIGLLNGFELRTRYGTVTEQELTSGRVITFLTLLLFQENHMLSKETIIETIWGKNNLLSHKTRTLNDVGYKAAKSIQPLFPSREFLEKDKYHYYIDRSYKITTELDVISYEIRDIEGVVDEDLRLTRYLELLDKFSATVLPRQEHGGIAHIVRRYDEKKKDLQNTVLELMCQMGKYEDMHGFINSLSVSRNGDAELAYWNIKALAGLGKYSFAREHYQVNREIFSPSQQEELMELLGIEVL